MTDTHHHLSKLQGSGSRSGTRQRLQALLLILLAGTFLALTSCSSGNLSSELSGIPVTDTQPVGDGLKVIGYAMLGAAVVFVLGRAVR